jgi:hypothetical protein
MTILNFFKIRADIRKSRLATGINDAGSYLPPVSTTPAANFATGFPGAVDIHIHFCLQVHFKVSAA